MPFKMSSKGRDYHIVMVTKTSFHDTRLLTLLVSMTSTDASLMKTSCPVT